MTPAHPTALAYAQARVDARALASRGGNHAEVQRLHDEASRIFTTCPAGVCFTQVMQLAAVLTTTKAITLDALLAEAKLTKE